MKNNILILLIADTFLLYSKFLAKNAFWGFFMTMNEIIPVFTEWKVEYHIYNNVRVPYII